MAAPPELPPGPPLPPPHAVSHCGAELLFWHNVDNAGSATSGSRSELPPPCVPAAGAAGPGLGRCRAGPWDPPQAAPAGPAAGGAEVPTPTLIVTPILTLTSPLTPTRPPLSVLLPGRDGADGNRPGYGGRGPAPAGTAARTGTLRGVPGPYREPAVSAGRRPAPSGLAAHWVTDRGAGRRPSAPAAHPGGGGAAGAGFPTAGLAATP